MLKLSHLPIVTHPCGRVVKSGLTPQLATYDNFVLTWDSGLNCDVYESAQDGDVFTASYIDSFGNDFTRTFTVVN